MKIRTIKKVQSRRLREERKLQHGTNVDRLVWQMLLARDREVRDKCKELRNVNKHAVKK